MPPVVYGLSSGTAALPSSALMIGAPSISAICSSSSAAPQRAAGPPGSRPSCRRSGSRPPAADRPPSGRRALRAQTSEV